MEVSGQYHAPATDRAPYVHWIRSYCGPRDGLDVLVKRKISCFCRDSRTGPASPWTGRYTDYQLSQVFSNNANCKVRHPAESESATPWYSAVSLNPSFCSAFLECTHWCVRATDDLVPTWVFYQNQNIRIFSLFVFTECEGAIKLTMLP
jgi:hypothetical protein